MGEPWLIIGQNGGKCDLQDDKMEQQEIHHLIRSSFLFFDNLLVDKGKAFKTVQDQELVKIEDKRVVGFDVWASKFSQWVYDEDIEGATIPETVKIDDVDTPLSNDVRIDFRYGRVLLANSNAEKVEVDFSYREANLYLFEDNDEAMLEQAFKSYEDLFTKQIEAAPPYRYIAPMCVLSYVKENEDMYSLGGAKNSEFILRLFILADNPFLAMGLTSLFAKTKNRCFPLIEDAEDFPLDFYGGLKNGSYSYADLVEKYKGSGKKYFIENAHASPTAPISRNKTQLHSSFVEFEIKRYFSNQIDGGS